MSSVPPTMPAAVLVSALAVHAACADGGGRECGPTIAILDDGGIAGTHSSVAIGPDGLGLIAYRDVTNQRLEVARCEDPACTGAAVSVVDGEGDVRWSSVAIGPDGLGLIAYRDATSGNLEVARCADPACAHAAVSVVDDCGTVGDRVSLAIGPDGLGLIAYLDAAARNLKVARCEDPACTGAAISVVDDGGRVGHHVSLAIGPDGLGLIAYHVSWVDFEDGSYRMHVVKVARCRDSSCSAADIEMIDTGTWGAGNGGVSIAVGPDGVPLVAFHQGNAERNLLIARCEDVSCASAAVAVLDEEFGVGLDPSLVVGADGLAVVAYQDTMNADLKVARCEDPACADVAISVVDGEGDVGLHASMAAGPDGLFLVSYYDHGRGCLKLASWDREECAPW